MTAQDNLNQRQFKMHHQPPNVTGHYEPDPDRYEGAQRWVDEDPSTGSHMLTASTGNNRPLGMLTWDKGQVKKVEVFDTEKWGRQGMATQMFKRAREITPGLRHSDNRTEMGQNWARKAGGTTPERVQDHPEWYQ